ncbi:hypothetical protein MZE69_22220 [Escherichia coli]|nr:hypothetical protein [Escherichia coli]
MKNFDTTNIIVNGEIIHLTPPSFKLLMHMLNNPAGQYFTGELRKTFGECRTRNLRPYFEELQSYKLIEPVFVYGRVIISHIAEQVDTAYGMPVFESCKKEEA